jgi:glycosyltransferase involved in cell wall biosynthesis
VRVLLLSAYAARSHVHWQQALQTAFSRWQWRVLTLPPRHFSWRVRGNALYWSMHERKTLDGDYDLLIATSMVDLATLRGLVPAMAQVPTVLYFHENQFEYPQARQQYNLVEAQLTSIYSALAADQIVFNSRYNRDSFVHGCAALLQKLPDCVPRGVVPTLLDKSSVIPVPFDGRECAEALPRWPGAEGAVGKRPLRLLWVGRFEHDKGGDGLLRILSRLDASGLDYELAMTGQQFRESPPVFKQIQLSFSHRVVQFGYVESISEYKALMGAADIVLSTALHEFQGLAVMESVALDCRPVVPRRLVYPEIYPDAFCYDSYPDDPEREAASAVALIAKLAADIAVAQVASPDVASYSLRRLAPYYEAVFVSTAAARDSH